MKKEAAFSGLEAAIVLIAFVVVAAVFSYVMLGAGFFATSKSQEVTYSGVKQSTSNIVLDGYLYGTYSTGLATLTFYVKVPEGGETQRLDQIDFLYTAGAGTPVKQTNGFSSTDKLAPGSRTKVAISSLSPSTVKAGSSFALEIKPKVGASYLIQRTLSNGYTGGVIY